MSIFCLEYLRAGNMRYVIYRIQKICHISNAPTDRVVFNIEYVASDIVTSQLLNAPAYNIIFNEEYVTAEIVIF